MQVWLQRDLNLNMMGFIWEEVLIYLNDLVIFVPMIEVFLEQLEKIFQRLAMANVRIKPSKCYFEYDQVIYIGHILSKNGDSHFSQNELGCLEVPSSYYQQNS